LAILSIKLWESIKKYISVSFEEYSFDEWEGVYKKFIEGKDNILIKSGYSAPKTFQ